MRTAPTRGWWPAIAAREEELDEAMAEFAVAYADRTEADHAELVAAVKSGRIAAEMGV